MQKFTGWIFCSVVCCVSLTNYCAKAATTKSKPAVTKPAIDPRAQRVLNEMAAVYRGLTTFSAHAKSQNDFKKESGVTQIEMAIAKPNRFFYHATGNKAEDYVSDGTIMVSMLASDKGRYNKWPMAEAKHGPLALMQYPTFWPLTAYLAGVDPFAPPWGVAPDSIRLKPNGKFGAVAVRIVEVSLFKGEMTQVYEIGRTDHLLYCLRATYKRPKSDVHYTYTYSDIKINPRLPDSTFIFKPPLGAVESKAIPQFANPKLEVGGDPLPFTATDLEGKTFSLDDYKGKVVLLDFWATWCNPCIEEMPYTQEAYRKFHDQGLEIIGISSDVDEKKLRDYLQKEKIPWRQVFDKLDKDSVIRKLYKIRGIPFTVLIGRDGKIITYAARFLVLEDCIERAVAESSTTRTAVETKRETKEIIAGH